MKAFFEGIETLFVNYLFSPFDFLRAMDSWWGSNVVNTIFILIGMVAFAYWMLQLKKFNDEHDESKVTHTY